MSSELQHEQHLEQYHSSDPQLLLEHKTVLLDMCTQTKLVDDYHSMVYHHYKGRPCMGQTRLQWDYHLCFVLGI